MKATLDHVGIAVRDLNEALRFFRDVLGLQVSPTEVVSDQQVRITEVETGGTSLEFLEATDPASPVARFLEQRGPGLHHITLAVDDLESALEHQRRIPPHWCWRIPDCVYSSLEHPWRTCRVKAV